jgi:hypothetical protein
MDYKTREEIIERAKKYNKDEFNRFLDDEGWQDWMNGFTNEPEEEKILEREIKEIKSIQKELFEIAHRE